jgi:flagellar hook-length control protein FliK
MVCVALHLSLRGSVCRGGRTCLASVPRAAGDFRSECGKTRAWRVVRPLLPHLAGKHWCIRVATVATSAIPSNNGATLPVAISATARGVPISQSGTDEPDFSSVLAQTNAAKPPKQSDPLARSQSSASKQSAATNPAATATGAKPAGQSASGTMPRIADPKQANIAQPKDSAQTKSSSASPKKASPATNAQSFLEPTEKQVSALPPFIGGMQPGPIYSETSDPAPEQSGSHREASGDPSQITAPGQNGENPGAAAETPAALQDGLLDALASGITAPTADPASKSVTGPQGKTSSQISALMQSLQPAQHRTAPAPAAQTQAPAAQPDANSQPAQKQGNENGTATANHTHGEQTRSGGDGSASQSAQQSPDDANATVTTPAPVVSSNAPLANPAANAASGISTAVGIQSSGAVAGGAALQVTPQTNASAAQPDLNALAINIAAKSQIGSKQFDISLEPAELGRVEVRLTVDNAGNAQAHLVAERPETLQMLQRDSGTLSHALKESGVQLGDNGLQFSLKGQERQGDGAQQGPSRGRPLSASFVTSTDKLLPVSSSYGLSLSQAGIDIRV